ncbi:hypothetical protein J5N97_029522 [Dioscorea zingiberensis]|uniref:FAE domain-containing protein n=1 Tax=Dioscorea zingiberensis TaxID=325984 RepID=A0A9D5C0U6_9LILI|nr:hypothetical protein J5N97_029522 [Dioscorea zingiberensis]
MAKVISSSGLSDETCLPSPLHYIPPRTHHDDCIQEAYTLLFPVLEDLFSKTTISPRDVDVLVLNCSGFCPSPSLSAIIVNGFAMHQRVKTFNISGMGCSASAISLDVARTLLQVHRGSYAVVVSTEVLSTGWYPGKDRRKLLLNCSFRTGSAAVLLSSKNEARGKSKYKLLHLVRSQRASDDKAHQSAIREEDSEGITGFTLERIYLKQVAMAALYLRAILSSGKTPVPDFLSAVQHYCMPASWKAVIEEVGRGLGVGPNEMDPALTMFRRFGNQSSSSMWYQLAYLEAKGRVSKGERVWQLAIGSGPKCNSLV